MPSHEPPPLIRVGVSACLLGQTVRYDGGHKRASFVADVLPRGFEVVPVCPEVAIGLGVPREPIRLEGDPAAPRAVGVETPALDVTGALSRYGREMAAELRGISGYVFKSKSPSCGLWRVKVFPATGAPRPGRGLYAAEITRAMPLLPVEEEGRLDDPALRENFVERVYAFHDWQTLLASGPTPERLVDFHASHKLIVMAHSRRHLTQLGRLVADVRTDRLDEYGRLFMEALARPATRRRHADVLYHLLGYLKRHLDAADKAELVELIEAFRTGQVPLIAPVTLLRHHFRRHPDPYVARQLYLTRAPAALGLWNAV